MSKTVKTLLLAVLFLGLSGSKIEASETPRELIGSKPVITCTSLHSYLVANRDKCKDKKLSQTENAIKAAVREAKNPEVIYFSYATEPVYFIEPTPIPVVKEPTPVADTVAVPTQSVQPQALQQVPQDLFPAVGPNIDSNLIFDMINTHRASIGKKAYEKEVGLCSLAQVRSVEIHDELFNNGNLHSGLYNRNLPYWITENAKWGSNEAGTIRWWLNSPIHRKAIEGDYMYSCGACNGTQCSQLFTSYIPKLRS